MPSQLFPPLHRPPPKCCKSVPVRMATDMSCGHWFLESVLIQSISPRRANARQLLADSCCTALGVTPESGVIFCGPSLLESFLRSCLEGKILQCYCCGRSYSAITFKTAAHGDTVCWKKQSFHSGVIIPIREPGSFPSLPSTGIRFLDSASSSLQERISGLRFGPR